MQSTIAPEIVWRKYRTCTGDGKQWSWTEPILPEQSGAQVLQRILTMPRKDRDPIGYDDAMLMFERACVENLLSPDSSRESGWEFRKTFVQWISQQGFFILLSHSEYCMNRNHLH